jgi:hypothetical protein
VRGLRIIKVGGQKVGLTGLDAVLEQFWLEGWEPGEPGLEKALVAALRQAGNYITPPEEPAYEQALGVLYNQFWALNPTASETKGGTS